MTDTRSAPPELEDVLHTMMQAYVGQKLECKYGIKWADAKTDADKKKTYNEKSSKIAKDAFLAVRSRTGGDFVAYFAGTLCSVSHFLPKERFSLVTKALREEPDRVRTITLLALSAVG